MGVVETNGGAGAGAGRVDKERGIAGGRERSLLASSLIDELEGGRRRPGRTELDAVGEEGPEGFLLLLEASSTICMIPSGFELVMLTGLFFRCPSGGLPSLYPSLSAGGPSLIGGLVLVTWELGPGVEGANRDRTLLNKDDMTWLT